MYETHIVLLSWLITVDVGCYVIVQCAGATVAFWGHPCPVYFDSVFFMCSFFTRCRLLYMARQLTGVLLL